MELTIEQMRIDRANELATHFEPMGLLEGLSGHDRVKMVHLLNNQAGVVEFGNFERMSEAVKTVTRELALPLVRKVMTPFLSKIGVMMLPADIHEMDGNREAIVAKTRWLYHVLPHYDNLNCSGYYRQECETKYTDEVAELLQEGVRKLIESRPDAMYYMYTPFIFLEAPLVENGVETVRLTAMTRGTFVKI